MNTRKTIVALLILMSAAIGNAWADHGHFHSRVFIGVGPYWGPSWYYPPPSYYYPPTVVYSSPPVYVEQQNTAPPVGSANNYWYYCAASKRYYPYVKDCPSGWQQVAPTPPGP